MSTNSDFFKNKTPDENEATNDSEALNNNKASNDNKAPSNNEAPNNYHEVAPVLEVFHSNMLGEIDQNVSEKKEKNKQIKKDCKELKNKEFIK
ncbi:8066_t:CDS:2, partial [Cetraspora pellucida]